MVTREKIRGVYAIVDNTYCPHLSLADLARLLLKGGAKILQLRQKQMDENDLLFHVRAIADLKKDFSFTFIVNDHPEIALQVGADGVHLGAKDRPIKEARKILGAGKIIGRSTHSLAEAVQAVEEKADYIAFGAIFPTTSKPKGHIVVGLDALRGVVQKIPIPVVAIGGINRTNIRQVLETGVASIAMISALTRTSDIVAETRYFVEQNYNSIVKLHGIFTREM